jgi:hypothetical protein
MMNGNSGDNSTWQSTFSDIHSALKAFESPESPSKSSETKPANPQTKQSHPEVTAYRTLLEDLGLKIKELSSADSDTSNS